MASLASKSSGAHQVSLHNNKWFCSLSSVILCFAAVGEDKEIFKKTSYGLSDTIAALNGGWGCGVLVTGKSVSNLM